MGAAVLDCVLGGVFALVILVITATAGGVGLAVRYQEISEGRVTAGSLFDGSFGREIGDRYAGLAREMEDVFTERFTPEQARRMAQAAGREMETMFLPAAMESGGVWKSIRSFAAVNENTLTQALDRAFQAAEREGIEGVSSEDLAAVRTEVDAFIQETGIARFLPDVIRYAVGVALSPFVALLVYGLVEALAGASVGKLILGLRIGNQDGRRASLGSTVARYLVKTDWVVLAVIALVAREPAVLYVAAAGLATSFFGSFAALGKEKRALHDYAAGTAVYRAAEMADRT